MAKSKNHHYVLVCTNRGPKFVTEILPHHECKWSAEDAPLEMSATWADDMCTGLMWNGYPAYHVVVPYALESQPFIYKRGHFEWIEEKPEN